MSERRVAGLYCSEVLDALADFLDDELDVEDRERVEGHLRGCDGCARFGGEYAEAVAALRRALSEAPPVPEELRARLRARLSEPRTPS